MHAYSQETESIFYGFLLRIMIQDMYKYKRRGYLVGKLRNESYMFRIHVYIITISFKTILFFARVWLVLM